MAEGNVQSGPTMGNSNKNPREAALDSFQGKFQSDADVNKRGKTGARSSHQLPDRARSQLNPSSPNH
mgnify:CR=1 FL=1